MTITEKDRLDIMEEKLTAVEQKLDRVLTALVGDSLGVDRGLVAVVKDNGERITRIETWRNKFTWMAIGVGMGGGVGLAKLVQWIQDSAVLSK